MCGALSVEKKFHRDKACKCTLMHVWGRKLVKSKSDTCDQYPTNSATSQVVWLSCRAIFANTNECHNRHVCNSSSEGTKVSFMLKETIYGKSLIFSPVIKSIPFFWPKYRLRYAYCHMIVIYILAQWNHKIIYTMKKCNELWSHVKTRVIIYN